ncbi:MAG: DUF998 domain-containing protein [Pseudomonadota bacterium]
MPSTSMVISYLSLRRIVGVIGISLPFVLAIGNLLLGAEGIEKTMSAYYYTRMGDVFVGSLFAIAVFLMTYQGWDWRDNLAGDVAGISAIGVALFPVAPELETLTPTQIVCDLLHATFAAFFFFALAYFCLVLFKKFSPDQEPTAAKIKRNKVYTVCGYAIVSSVVLIGVQYALVQLDWQNELEFVFWLEALAIVAFGVSWFVKGEGILQDAGS